MKLDLYSFEHFYEGDIIIKDINNNINRGYLHGVEIVNSSKSGDFYDIVMHIESGGLDMSVILVGERNSDDVVRLYNNLLSKLDGMSLSGLDIISAEDIDKN